MCNNVYVYFAKNPVELHIVTHKKKIYARAFYSKASIGACLYGVPIRNSKPSVCIKWQ